MPLRLLCEDFERVGAWPLSRCCPSCHEDARRGVGGIELSLLCEGVEVELEVCCAFTPPCVTEREGSPAGERLLVQAVRAKDRRLGGAGSVARGIENFTPAAEASARARAAPRG